MTASNWLYILAVALAVFGTRAYADGDVTVISPTSSSSTTHDRTLAADGTPIIHKSLHKKKRTTTSTDSRSASIAGVTTAPTSTVSPHSAPTTVRTASGTLVIASTAATASGSASPTVETDLPVGRYPTGAPIKGVSTFIPSSVVVPSGKAPPGLFALLPSTTLPTTAATPMIYTTPRSTTPPDDFVFTNFTKKIKNYYPWRTDIITTIFWIGEGGTTLSPTDNVASAWDSDWRSTNSGSDSPNDRNGYAPARHAATVNPFYVALPFNDLAFPDKAREWLPRGWYRRPREGKQVSACKDRWVEIKNEEGRVCYAQWEDDGPLTNDDAEYVFGNERPIGLGNDHAGLDVSPAVADYLHLTDRNRVTSWRFVDDEDVRPGDWLKLDEEAVIYTALHQLKTFRASPNLPLQDQSAPTDDPASLDSNKKKVDASKG